MKRNIIAAEYHPASIEKLARLAARIVNHDNPLSLKGLVEDEYPVFLAEDPEGNGWVSVDYNPTGFVARLEAAEAITDPAQRAFAIHTALTENVSDALGPDRDGYGHWDPDGGVQLLAAYVVEDCGYPSVGVDVCDGKIIVDYEDVCASIGAPTARA